MLLSRLRLRLAGWFALCLLASLAVLDLSLYWYLRSHADRRLTRDLESAANQLAAASRREFEESPARGLPEAARNAVEEWPAGPEAVAVYDAAGRLVARGGPAELSAFVPPTAPIGTTDVPLRGDEAAARLVPSSSDGAPRFTALVVGSTERVTEDGEALAWWLALSAPLAAALSLVGGYLISRRALRPLGELERAVAAVGPAQLDRRLPVTEPADEVGRLAIQFNALLARLGESQAQARLFLRRAAHQIRTPLTLVLGESELSLDRPRSSGDYREALARVHRAAGQMRRRVDELFLLAQAEAGETIVLDAVVDLEEVALQVTDLVRPSAQSAGRPLSLDSTEPVAVRGSVALLEEAVLELLDNACRHSAPGATVSISTFRAGAAGYLAVSSVGEAVPLADESLDRHAAAEASGLGLPIVRWIAKQHGGDLLWTHHAGQNTYALVIPVAEGA